jgi:hypothetical protein
MAGLGSADSVRVDDTSSNIPASCHRIIECIHTNPALYPVQDGVADDALGKHVVDRAGESFPSAVLCSVMSLPHSSFGHQ